MIPIRNKKDYQILLKTWGMPFAIVIFCGGIVNADMPWEFFLTDDGYKMALGSGLGALFVGYYPIKLIVFFINRFKKGKWEWPIGYRYFIIPILICLLMVFF